MDTRNSSPVFIVGTPRSGTTLMAKILGRDKDLFMPGETHYFLDIYSSRKELGNLSDPDVKNVVLEKLRTLYGRYNEPPDQKRADVLFSNSSIVDKLKACNEYDELFSVFMQLQTNHENKNRWGNNAPNDIFYIDNILSIYPNAKIIVCVRDIRNFLLSYKNKWRATTDEHVDRIKQLYHPVITSLLWKSSMKLIPAIRKMVPKDNLIIVPYENVVASPEKTIRDVCQCIDIEFDENLLNVETNNSSFESNTSGIFQSSLSRWKTGLGKEDAWIAQFIAKSQMSSLGYEIEKINPDFFKIAILFIQAPVAFYRALQANKDSRGSLVPYLIRRIRALFA